MLKLKVKPTYKYLVHASTVEPDRLPASSVRGSAVRMANATTTCLAQRASVLEELVGREDRGAGSFGQRQGIGRMTRQGCFVMGLSDVERGGYPGSVFIQHHTKHARVEMDEEPVDELQHRDAWTAGEPEYPGQTASLFTGISTASSSRRSISSSTTVAVLCPG